jgi:hypothetical protein
MDRTYELIELIFHHHDFDPYIDEALSAQEINDLAELIIKHASRCSISVLDFELMSVIDYIKGVEMTEKEAINFLHDVILKRLGRAYHPESTLGDYVDEDDKMTFTPTELLRYEPKHRAVKRIFGDKIYDVLNFKL